VNASAGPPSAKCYKAGVSKFYDPKIERAERFPMPTLPDVTIRNARPEEAEALTALSLRSKAHWGYDADFMRRCIAVLTLDPGAIAAGSVFVAVDDADRPLGVAGIEVRDEPGCCEVTRLFVAPEAMGRGIGRALFGRLVAWMQERGYARLLILSDPQAEAFYKRCGAVRLGMAPSDAIPDRELPRLAYTIPD